MGRKEKSTGWNEMNEHKRKWRHFKKSWGLKLAAKGTKRERKRENETRYTSHWGKRERRFQEKEDFSQGKEACDHRASQKEWGYLRTTIGVELP